MRKGRQLKTRMMPISFPHTIDYAARYLIRFGDAGLSENVVTLAIDTEFDIQPINRFTPKPGEFAVQLFNHRAISPGADPFFDQRIAIGESQMPAVGKVHKLLDLHMRQRAFAV